MTNSRLQAHYVAKLPPDTLDDTARDRSPVGHHADGTLGTHQDAYFWPFRPTLSPAHGGGQQQVSVWLALDPVTRERGAMLIYNGSHKLGCMHAADCSDGGLIPKRSMETVRSTCGEPVVAGPLRPGEASVHSDLAAHSSPPNPTPYRRLGVSIQYVCADGTHASGQRWGHGVVVPPGTALPSGCTGNADGSYGGNGGDDGDGGDGMANCTFWSLPRPTVYGPGDAESSPNPDHPAPPGSDAGMGTRRPKQEL